MKATKKSLLSSVLALALCFAMLLGTTFAWFTDSAVSKDNKIQAGTLDVELWQHTATEDRNISSSSAPLFTEDTIWEPGRTEIVYLSIKNNGSLDLKYKVALETKETSDHDLREVMSYAITPDAKVGDVDGWLGQGETAYKLDTESALTVAAEDVSLEAGAEHFFALSVHMDEEAGNVYMGDHIVFDLKVLAAQLASEEDGFNNSDYDADADYADVSVVTLKETSTASTAIKTGAAKVTMPAGMPAGTYEFTVSNESTTEDATTGNTTLAFDLDLTKDGTKVESAAGVSYVVSYNIGKNQNITEVTHNGKKVEGWTYKNDVVTFTVDSFSPFAIEYYSGSLETAEDAKVHLPKGGNFVLAADITVGETLHIPAGVEAIVDLNGKTITGTMAKSIGHVIKNEGTLLLKNGTVSSAANNGGSAIYNNEGATLTLDDVKIIGAPQSGDGWPSYAINSYGKLTVNFADITSTHGAIALFGDTVINNANVVMNGFGGSSHVFYIGGEGTEVIINDGTYTHKGNTDGSLAYIMSGASMTVNGGSFSASNGGYGLAAYVGALTVNGGHFTNAFQDWGGPIVISGGTFVAQPNAKYIADGYQAIKEKSGLWSIIPETDDGADIVATDIAGVYKSATDNKTYYIFNKTGLMNLNTLFAAIKPNEGSINTVNLSADIDLTGEAWEPINAMWVTFNGNGHTISNLNAGLSADGRRSGFWAYAGAVTIKNLTLENVTVSGSQVGAFAGAAEGLTMENCFLKGVNTINYVAGVETWNGIGAFVGVNVGSKINAEIVAGATVNLNKGNLITDSACKYIDDLTGHVQANNGTVTNNGTLTVTGRVLYFVADGLAKNPTANEYFVSNANGLSVMNAMIADKTAGKAFALNLLADIDFTGYTWTTVDSHVDCGCYLKELNGNGYTLSNLKVNGQAMFSRFAGSGDVIIKDITFDGANVNSNGKINTAILTVQSYQNLLLDNVDVKNSTISGGYKVATLIGTVYNENPASSITATIKNCDIENCTVTSTVYDFMTCGVVAFVYEGDGDKVVFENSSISDVTLYNTKSNGYSYHAFVYYTDAPVDDCFNEADGITVNNCNFISLE